MRLPSRARPELLTRERLDSPTSESGEFNRPNSWPILLLFPGSVPTVLSGPTHRHIQLTHSDSHSKSTLESVSRGKFPPRPLNPNPNPVQGKEPERLPMKKNKEGGVCHERPSSHQPHPRDARLALRNHHPPLWHLGHRNSSLSPLLQGLRTLLTRSRSPHQIRPADRDGRFAVSPNTAGGLSCVWSLLGGRRFRATAARSFLSESGLVSA